MPAFTNAEPILLRTLRNQPTERPPVWLMRQAGRYLAEYRLLKEKHGFLGLCRSPELATEITMQPIRRLNPDAAILFSDILLPAECLGLRVEFNPGPKVINPIRTSADVSSLRIRDVKSSLPFVFEAVRQIRRELENLGGPSVERKALIGFAGSPWTMACYLIDQGIYKHFSGTSIFARNNPSASTALLNLLADLTSDYLIQQIDAGADAVQLFDTWGGILSPADYRQYSLPYIQRIFEQIGSRVPTVLYVNGSGLLLEEMTESGATCLSIDWRTSFQQAVSVTKGRSVIQGNFDPTHLFGPIESIVRETREMLQSAPKESGYIANLGHGILPGTPVENVGAFIRTLKGEEF